MVGAAVQVMFPRPLVFQRHELVHIHGATIEQSFIFGVDAPGEIVDCWPFGRGIATGHGLIWLSG
jgi:hypothetical protein